MIYKNSINRPILITGSHRSGTTWVGKVINQSDNILYVPDPFQPNGLLRRSYPLDQWYRYFNDNEGKEFKNQLCRISSLNYSYREAFHLKNRLPETDYRNPKGINTHHFNFRNTPWRMRYYRDCLIAKLFGKSKTIIPVFKDPIALFSSRWFHVNMNSKNILLIRHPAAFVSSLKRMEWQFDFRNFTNQPSLMKDLLYPFENELYKPIDDIIVSGSILWNCIHHAIHLFQKEFPDWIYKKHEDLSINPLEEFEDIFQRTQLPFTDKVKDYITLTTSEANPAEVTKSGKIHQLKRDSRKSIKNWKNRLTSNEIEKIYNITSPISQYFYTDNDWK